MTAGRAALFYAGSLCLLWALVPSLLFPNPPLDVVEGYAWGREMALGYTKHPPMQAWLLEISFQLTGGSSFGGYWLSALSIAAGYAFIWALARRMGLSQNQAFWAVVLTSVTFYFTIPVPEFNPNILQIPVWAGMIFFFHRGLSENRMADWIALGVLAAFGLYTKYFVALLIGAIGLYALVFPAGWRILAKPGPYVAAATAMILIAPHVVWLIQTDFITFSYAASRSVGAQNWFDHVYNPLNFLAAQIANHGGLFLVCLAGLGIAGVAALRKSGQFDASEAADTQDRRFLIWFASVPLTVVLLTSLATGNDFKHMWGTPMFVLSGVLTVWFLRLPGAFTAPRRALAVACMLQIVVFGATIGQASFEPLWKTKQTRIHYPGAAIAAELTAIWRTETGTHLAYVAGDMWSTANITLFSPDRPSMFLEHDLSQSPWIDFSDVQKKGVMIVWRGEESLPPAGILQRYPALTAQGVFDAPYAGGGKMPPAVVNWTIIPAGSVAHDPEAQTE
ncbi:UDP-phosphomannose--protein mannosyltransferase [Roseibium aquae]|uniref:UDP-phosphomannose--protein mannosyltransferase n=1 Tax=Roseibium aquae TaxID=1323746 RepID=A0A916X392_9HYPH|nr:glycosyltransferase family 39 protein [Roseibium aquae]GGB61533.1 UDP-phosphomannose--protein mannosyltransferase [Roseibium aquae]